MTNEKILIMFLNHYGIYENFVTQIENYKIVKVEKAILSFQCWSETKEKGLFWRGVNRKWQRMCEDLKLKNNIDLFIV